MWRVPDAFGSRLKTERAQQKCVDGRLNALACDDRAVK
jgi:hypothetical protein